MQIKKADGTILWQDGQHDLRVAVLAAIRAGRSLKGAILDRVNLAYLNTELIRANFDGCSLINADFYGSTLTAASFVGADVSGADFTRTSLAGANFQEATLDNAVFANAYMPLVNFSKASPHVIGAANRPTLTGAATQMGEVYFDEDTGQYQGFGVSLA